jgi:Domain of unknown function (DUF3850)
MCRLHQLKCVVGFYDAVAYGPKKFEYRKNDRCFKELDILRLREWDGENYTGRWCDVLVTYIFREGFGLPEGYCVMGIGESPIQVFEPEGSF